MKSKEIVDKKKSIEESLKILKINDEIKKLILEGFLNDLFIEEKIKTLQGSLDSLQSDVTAKEEELSFYLKDNSFTNAQNQMAFFKLNNFEIFFIDWENFFYLFNYMDQEKNLSSIKITDIDFLIFYESLKNLHSFFFSNEVAYTNFFLKIFFRKFFNYLNFNFFKFFRFTDENLKKKLIFEKLLRILDKQDFFFLRNFSFFYDNFFFLFNFLTHKDLSFLNVSKNFFSEILPNKLDVLVKQVSLNFYEKILSKIDTEITALNRTILDINLDIENFSFFKDPFYNFFFKVNLDKQDFFFLLDFFYKENSNKVSFFFFNKFNDILNFVLQFNNLSDSIFVNNFNNFCDFNLDFTQFSENVLSIFSDKFFVFNKLFSLIYFFFDLLSFLKNNGLFLNLDNKFLLKIFFYQIFIFSFNLKIFDDSFFILFLNFLDTITEVFKKLFGYFIYFFKNFQKSDITKFVDFFLADYDFFKQLLNNSDFCSNFD